MMLTIDEIKDAYHIKTHKLYLDKLCARCSQINNERVFLYAYLFEKQKLPPGIYSLCSKCHRECKTQYGPAYPLSTQELFVYLSC